MFTALALLSMTGWVMGCAGDAGDTGAGADNGSAAGDETGDAGAENGEAGSTTDMGSDTQ